MGAVRGADSGAAGAGRAGVCAGEGAADVTWPAGVITALLGSVCDGAAGPVRDASVAMVVAVSGGVAALADDEAAAP